MNQDENQPQIDTDDSVIIKNVIEALNTNASKLSKDLGYKSTTSIYHIIEGQNNITLQLAERIVDLYPNVNFLYLTRGKHPVIRENNTDQQNMMQKTGNLNDLLKIPRLLEEILAELKEMNSKK